MILSPAALSALLGVMPPALNDNLAEACAHALARSNVEVLVDAHRDAQFADLLLESTQRGLARDAAGRALVEEQVFDLKFAFPRVGLNALGEVIKVTPGPDDRLRVALALDDTVVRRFDWPAETWLDDLASVSPDGRFAVVTDANQTRQRLVRVADGRVLLERTSFSPTAPASVSMQFSVGGEKLVVRRGDFIELFALEGDDGFEVAAAAYDLGALRGADGRPVARGEVYALDRTSAAFGFFNGPAPVRFELGAKYEVTHWPVREVAGGSRFLPWGVVSPSERLVAVGRVSPRGDYVIDVHDARTLAHRRTFKSDGPVLALAFTPDENALAVAFRRGVRVFDLRNARDAGVRLTVPAAGDAILSFTAAHDLLVGSKTRARLLRFRTPAR